MQRIIHSNQYLFRTLGREGLLRANPDCKEYLVTISPGGKIGTHVLRCKDYLLAHLRHNHSLHSKPHFTIVSFLAPPGVEGRFLRALDAACARMFAAFVNVGSYGKFENGEGRSVIFVRTEESLFLCLQNLIRHEMLAERLQLLDAIFPMMPHLTVVKDLWRAQLNYWWARMADRPYQDRFFANGLSVLRRELVAYSRCEELERMSFSGDRNAYVPLVKPKQGVLLFGDASWA